MFLQRNKKNKEAGIAALPTILLSSLIIMELVAAGLLISYLLNLSSLGARRSNETLAAAQAGILDAEMRITRNKNITDSQIPYNMDFGNNLYNFVIIKNLTSDYYTIYYAIDSLGYISAQGVGGTQQFSRCLEAKLNVSSSTGKVELKSFKEMNLLNCQI